MFINPWYRMLSLCMTEEEAFAAVDSVDNLLNTSSWFHVCVVVVLHLLLILHSAFFQRSACTETKYIPPIGNAMQVLYFSCVQCCYSLETLTGDARARPYIPSPRIRTRRALQKYFSLCSFCMYLPQSLVVSYTRPWGSHTHFMTSLLGRTLTFCLWHTLPYTL